MFIGMGRALALAISILCVSTSATPENGESATSRHTPKILVYNPRFAHSHSNFMGMIADVLAEEGHDVTSLIPILYPPYKDGTTKSRIIHIEGNPETVAYFDAAMNSAGDMSKIWLGSSEDPSAMLVQTPMLRRVFSEQCAATIRHPGLIDRLTNEHFDVVIAENFDFCGIGLFHLIKARSLILTSSTNAFDYQLYQMGAPLAASHVPASFGVLMEEMTMWQRLKNLYLLYANIQCFSQIEAGVEAALKGIYGEEFPALGEITANASFLLTNTDPLADFSRPTLRNIVDIGGLGVRAKQSLSKEWEEILSRRRRSFVVSFGTVSRAFLMPDEFKRALVSAFARFDDTTTFIWKYEKDASTLPLSADNVVLAKWMPQNDLLYDPRVVGILSHGGKGSVAEAAEHGIPALFVPLFADQPRNAAAAAHLGVGRVINKQQLSDEDAIAAAVNEILENDDLRQAARALQQTLAGRPFLARELLTRTVTFAARYGPQRSLEYSGRKLSFLAFHNLDLLLLVELLLVLFLITICLGLKSILSRSSVKQKRQ